MRIITCKKNSIIFLIILSFILTGQYNFSVPGNRTVNRKERYKEWKKHLESDVLPEKAIKLKYEFSFPGSDIEESDVYLRYGSNLCFDDDGKIYVSDSQNDSIYKFNPEGSFLKKIGNSGKGPGDVFNPKFLCSTDSGDLIVYDAGNHRIQTFDPNGQYRESFRIFEIYSSLITDKKGLLFCSPMDFGKPLIRIFNYKGESLGVIGSQVKLKRNIFGLNRVHMSMNSKTEIYVGWELFPIVRRYSQDGKLISEYRLEYTKMLKNAQFNYHSIDSSSRQREYKIVIASLRAKDDGFFIFRFYPRIEILEYNNNGELQNVYWAEQSYDFIGNDFLVKSDAGKKIFYILQVFPENVIIAYSVPN